MAETHDEKVAHLTKLVKEMKVAMLVTFAGDGSLRSRPMATQDAPVDGRMWFFTRATDGKVEELAHDPRVNLSFMDRDRQHYVSITGNGQVVDDRAKARELWNPAYKAWFPKGLDDPDLALISVSVDRAEYWDAPTSTMVHLVGFVKATLTGQSYNPGTNEKVDLAGTGPR